MKSLFACIHVYMLLKFCMYLAEVPEVSGNPIFLPAEARLGAGGGSAIVFNSSTLAKTLNPKPKP